MGFSLRHNYRFGFLVGALTLASCSSDPPAAPPPEETPPPSGVCVADPVLIAEALPCTADTDCPCRAACDLGRCVGGCTGDAACASDQSCDRFGRCRNGTETGLVAPSPRARPAHLDILDDRVIGAADGVERPLSFIVRDTDAGPIRIAASEELEVRCDMVQSYASECMVMGAMEGDRVTVWVRNIDGPGRQTGVVQLVTGEVDIFQGDEAQTVPFATGPFLPSPTGELVPIRLPGPFAADHLSGRYEGTLEVLNTGALNARTDVTGFPSLPITGRVHLDFTRTSGVIVIEDPHRVLHPDGEWVGDLSNVDVAALMTAPVGDATDITLRVGSADLTVPNHVTVEGAFTSQDASRVVALHQADPIVVRDTPAGGVRLFLEMDISYRGIAIHHAPSRRVRVLLSRVEGLAPADVAPVLPPSVALPDVYAMARAPSTWESAFEATIAPWNGMPTGPNDPFVDSWFIDRASSTLDGCFQPESHRSSVHEDLPLSSMRDVRLTTPTWAEVQTAAAAYDGNPVEQVILSAVADAMDSLFNDESVELVSLTTSADLELTGPGRGTISTLGVPRAYPDFIPCDGAGQVRATVDWRTQPMSLNLVRQASVPIQFPTCAELEDLFGCNIIRPSMFAPVGWEDRTTLTYTGVGVFRPFDITMLTFDASFSFSLWPSGLLGFAHGSDACRLPPQPIRCGDYASCYVDEATAATSTGLLGATAGAISGDLTCGSHGGGLTLDAGLDLDPMDMSRPPAGDVFSDCLAELEGFAATPPSGTSPEDIISSGATCIDPARFMAALAMTTDRERRHYTQLSPRGVEIEETLANAARAQRLVQRWAQLHAFMAREAVERETLAAIIRAEPASNVPDLDRLLDLASSGWDLLMHPRFSFAVLGRHGEVLADPDYRERSLGAPFTGNQPHHEQDLHAAVAIMDMASAHLDLAHAVLERAAFRGSRQELGTVSALLRRVDAGTAMAHAVLQDAAAYTQMMSSTAPDWKDELERSEAKAKQSYGRVLTAIRQLELGANPFGIEDEDLPLYFLGDQTGANGRFAAISDFLLGAGPSDPAWAPSMVSQAEGAVVAARAAWMAQQDRELAITETMNQNDARVDEIRTRYGERLADLCGRPGMSTADQLLDWSTVTGHPFSAESCFVDTSRPECLLDPSVYMTTVTREDIGAAFVQASYLRTSTAIVSGSDATTFDEVVTYFTACSPQDMTFPTACTLSGGSNCMSCQTTNGPLIEIPVTLRTLRRLQEIIPAGPSRPIELAALQIALSWYPGSRPRLPSVRAIEDNLPDPTCFRGTIGQETLSLRALAEDMQEARQRFDDATAEYDAKKSACDAQSAAALAERLELAASHKATMKQLSRLRDDLQDALENMEAAAACAAATFIPDPTGLTQLAVCGIGSAEKTAISIAILQIQEDMRRVEQEHLRSMNKLGIAKRNRPCYDEAEVKMAAVGDAERAFRQAFLETGASRVRYTELIDQARAAFQEGNAAVVEADAQRLLPMSHDFWLDGAVATYSRKMRLARRATYLAVRAVEYEFQMSHGLRQDVFVAELPADLDAVLDGLWGEAGARQINGRRPTDLKVIISLKEDLLQIADQSEEGLDGHQNLSDEDKLRIMLTDSRFEIYDDTGTYIGQRIPFTISPLRALELGDPSGIAVIADNDCAERLWSVNASIVGDPNLYVGSATTFARMELHKANTFYSQWCNNTPRIGDFQMASVRPSRNLFREPGLGSDVGSVLAPLGTAHTSARIEAYFNVARADFESDTYQNGETSELAARGLYGEYWLFLPASTLTTYDGDGNPVSDGIDLNLVDDVLLRLDYVSVARN